MRQLSHLKTVKNCCRKLFRPAVNESLLVFEGNNGELYWAEFTDSSGQLLDVVKYNPITEEALLGGEATDLLP